MKPPPIDIYKQLCQIEIRVRDITASMHFYENVFGWHKAPAEMAHYHVLQVASDSTFGIALVESATLETANHNKIVLYLKVHEFDSYLKRVEAFGGKIIRENFSLPGYGTVAHIADPDQHCWGLFLEKKRVNTPG